MSESKPYLLAEVERRGWEVRGPYDGQYVITHPEISEKQHPMHINEWLVDWVELEIQKLATARGMLYAWLYGHKRLVEIPDLINETELVLKKTTAEGTVDESGTKESADGLRVSMPMTDGPLLEEIQQRGGLTVQEKTNGIYWVDGQLGCFVPNWLINKYNNMATELAELQRYHSFCDCAAGQVVSCNECCSVCEMPAVAEIVKK